MIESNDEDAEAKSYDETNFNENKATCKMQNSHVLLIAVGIYCYLIKYRGKQLLPYHYTNNKLREIDIDIKKPRILLFQ